MMVSRHACCDALVLKIPVSQQPEAVPFKIQCNVNLTQLCSCPEILDYLNKSLKKTQNNSS